MTKQTFTGKNRVSNPLPEGPESTQQSVTAVNKGAKPAEAISRLKNNGFVDGSVRDLGGAENNDCNYELKGPEGKGATPPGGAGRGDDTDNAVKPGNSLRPEVLKQLQLRKEELDNETSEAFDSLVEGESTLTDEFKLQAKTIFEAALQQYLEVEIVRLEETYAERFDQAVVVMAEQVEAFMDYSSTQWLNENRIAVEDGIRSQLNESFLQGLSNLFKDHYVSVPDEKFEVFEAMVSQLDEMEAKLNEQVEANVNLNEALLEAHREILVQEQTRGLTEVQRDKLQRLSESVSYEGNPNKFVKQLETLKESFLTERGTSAEVLVESYTPRQERPISDSMEVYLNALSRK